ncbi:ABC transporter substrate-binding protein [Gorillibacterium massiliense]|uniref:ABC transporter substrate-binding protein n=1 Tax=Gorillibacterium massiliense TaxID=1280390 RepID=UPI0004AE69F2|nr:extracellular solute-binding protein [Gorillibacterium massiliense]
MKKRMAGALTSALLMVVLTTACGSSGGNNASESPSSSKQSSPANSASPSETSTASPSAAPEVTMIVQYPKSDNANAITAAEDKMKRFGQQYPNVTLKKNDWQYNPNEIGIKMAAHQAPSWYRTFATEGKTLLQHQWLADLSPFFAHYEHASDFNEQLTGPFTMDGKLYAVPANGYIVSVMINKKLFAEKNVPVPSPDWTWDDFYAAAKAIADPAKGIAGFAPMAKGNEGGWNFTNFLYAAGGTVENVADGKVTSAFNSDAAVKAMEFYKKLRWDGNALPQNWALNYGDVFNLFKQGRVAMVLGEAIEDAVNNGGMSKDDVMILPVPSMEKGGDHTGVLGGNFDVINPQESPDVQQAAFNYVTFDLFKDTEVDALKKTIEDRKAKGQILVFGKPAYYKSDSEHGKKLLDLVNQYPDTVVKLDPKIVSMLKGVPEPAYNGQDSYAALTNVIQEVFTNKNADVKKLLDDAAHKFDTEVLSKVTVK